MAEDCDGWLKTMCVYVYVCVYVCVYVYVCVCVCVCVPSRCVMRQLQVAMYTKHSTTVSSQSLLCQFYLYTMIRVAFYF